MTIDLEPELMERLRRVAQSQGMEPEAYATKVLERETRLAESERSENESLTDLPSEEWVKEFNTWVDNLPPAPALPPEAFERASFYEGRE